MGGVCGMGGLRWVLTAVFLECSGFGLVVAASPVTRWLDMIPIAFGLTQMGGTAAVFGSTMATGYLSRRHVVMQAESFARHAAQMQKGQ